MNRSRNVKNPKEPVGICDVSGFMYNHSDLVKQYQYVGNNLVWTGLMVGRDQLDTPNEQDRPFIAKPEGLPVINARPNIIKDIPNFYGPSLTPNQVLEQLRKSLE